MLSSIVTFSLLYLPLIFSVLSVAAAVKCKLTNQSVLTIQPLGIFGVSFPINSALLARCFIVLSAFCFLALYGVVDYSSVFPQQLTMDVYFDENGLRRVIDQIFSQQEQTDLGIVQDYSIERAKYFDSLDREASPILGEGSFFAVTNGYIHSSGSTSFRVRKINGIQRYHIEESKGELMNTLDAPHIPQIQFSTFFEKIPTSDDYLDPPLWDLVRKGITVRPRFKESLAEDKTSRSVSFSIAIIGITKGTIFPWPHFSSTVYCADIGNRRLVPIAYAIYKVD